MWCGRGDENEIYLSDPRLIELVLLAAPPTSSWRLVREMFKLVTSGACRCHMVYQVKLDWKIKDDSESKYAGRRVHVKVTTVCHSRGKTDGRCGSHASAAPPRPVFAMPSVDGKSLDEIFLFCGKAPKGMLRPQGAPILWLSRAEWEKLPSEEELEEQAPSDDAVIGQLTIDNILMVCVDDYFLSQKYVSELFKSLHYRQELLLSCRIVLLCAVHLSTVESKRLAFLHNHCSKLVIAGLGVYMEGLCEIRES